MQDDTLLEMLKEAEAAEREQEDDRENPRYYQPPYKQPNASIPDYQLEIPASPYSTVLLDKGNKKTQEDRADAVLCSTEFTRRFHTRTLSQQSELFKKALREIDQHPEIKKVGSEGSTFTGSFIWVTVDDSGVKTAHMLNAQVGDSRVVLCSAKGATRLTCDHTVLRPHEQTYLEKKGFTIKKINSEPREERFEIYAPNRKLVALHDDVYLAAPHSQAGLQISRSLGDHDLRYCPVFRAEPSMSYKAFPLTSPAVLITCSDGITDIVTDENLFNMRAPHDMRQHAKRVMHFALQHGEGFDNASIVITCLNDIKPGELIFQYDADGHSGSAVSQFVHDNVMMFLLRNFFEDNSLPLVSEIIHAKRRVSVLEVHPSFHAIQGMVDKKTGVFLLAEDYATYQYPSLKATLDDFNKDAINFEVAIQNNKCIFAEIENALCKKLLASIVETQWKISGLLGGTNTYIDGEKYNFPKYVSKIVGDIKMFQENARLVDAYCTIFNHGNKGHTKGKKTGGTSQEFYAKFESKASFSAFLLKMK